MEGTCKDLDECLYGNPCVNGNCTNLKVKYYLKLIVPFLPLEMEYLFLIKFELLNIRIF